MSFGKSSQSSNQEMDPQIKGALLDVYNTGRGLSRTPYNPYNFATVAPMSPFQQQGMQATLDAARGGIGQEQMNSAINAAQGVAGYSPSQVSTQNVSKDRRPEGDVRPVKAAWQMNVFAQPARTRFSRSGATVAKL